MIFCNSLAFSVTQRMLAIWPLVPLPSTISPFAQIHVHWVGDAIYPSHPLPAPSPFAFYIFLSIRVFSNESSFSHQAAKYWSFSFSTSSSNEYSWLISFRIDCFDLLAVQRTLKSLLQDHNLKASILWHSAFFMVQLLHLNKMTGNTIALPIWAFILEA